MSEHFLVPVKTWLKPAWYRQLAVIARKNSTTVEVLVGECVRRVLAGETLTATPKPKHRRQRWTASDTAQLERLYADGLHDAAIAVAMGRPISTVFKRREDLGLPSRHARLGRPKKNPAA